VSIPPNHLSLTKYIPHLVASLAIASDELDYVIPGNDDAIRAVNLIVSKMADAVIEANQGEEAVAADAEEVAEEA